jgi:hypothetical protein
VPTGDKLFDHFAAAAVARLKPVAAKPRKPGQSLPVILRPADTEGWAEGKSYTSLGYWQLEYWLGVAEYLATPKAAWATAHGAAQSGSPAPSGAPASPGSAGAGQGNPAARRTQPGQGVYPDPATEPLPRELLKPLLRQDELGYGTADSYLTLYEAELAAMDPQAAVAQREPMLAWLDKSIDMDPALSWSYYLRALHYLDSLPGEPVEWDNVAAALVAGNKAARNARPQPWPLSWAATHSASVKGAGCAELAGALIEAAREVQACVPVHEMIARSTRRVLARCAETGDPRLAQEWVAFLCRFGQMDEATLEDMQVAARALRLVAHYMSVDMPRGATWEQREDVFETQQWMIDSGLLVYQLERSLEQARLWRCAEYYRRDGVPAGEIAALGELKDYPASVPLGERWRCVYELRREEEEVLSTRYKRLLFDIARFDFATLRLPYELSPVNIPKREAPVIPDVGGLRGVPQPGASPPDGGTAAPGAQRQPGGGPAQPKPGG